MLSRASEGEDSLEQERIILHRIVEHGAQSLDIPLFNLIIGTCGVVVDDV